MDIDSPPPSSGGSPSSSSSSSSSSAASFSASSVSSHDRILQRLAVFGVPEDYFEDLQPGLVCFVKSNKSLLPEIVSTILPNDADIASAVNEGTSGSRKALDCLNLRDQYREGVLWLKWLMFEADPSTALKNLAISSAGQRGVCGAVWGKNDLAFRCRTCEHDPTCAICVPCFQNGNHENHDYSIIYTGGGCCDCGDETAWKLEGFCSKHKGAEQIVPLSDDIASSVGPVLDILLKCWKGKLMHAEAMSRETLDVTDHSIEPRKVANGFSYAAIEMLLDFCCHSESLLSFVAKRLIITADLLNLLVRAERFLSTDVTKKLHELLLKLLAEPMFKYEFAKVFIDYYPVTVAEVLRASTDIISRKFPLLSTFSVQIFTVPTLTPRLVKERNLLAVLLECFGDILLWCCEEEGQFQFNKWASVFETCTRVVEDIRFVLSHADVAKYVTRERPDILKAWLQTVSLMQGINPLKRETGIHIEEDNEHVHLPFLMCDSVSKIHLLLVKGAFSVSSIGNIDPSDFLKEKKEDIDEGFNQRHAKVGRLSGESSVCNSAAHNSLSDLERRRFDHRHDYILEPTVLKLTFESLRVIDSWLARSNVFSSSADGGSNIHLLALKETLSALKKGKYLPGPCDVPYGVVGKLYSCTDAGQTLACSPMDTADLQCDSIMETESSIEKDAFSLLSLSEWPDIDYDVSSQEISLHIPLHWLLSSILKAALQSLFGEAVEMHKHVSSYLNPMLNCRDFFQSMMKGCHPSAFSSFIMEHPLQNRVFCSQMRAGMWRRNGDNAVSCFDWYRAIRWSGHELEEDLFLLQLCAAFAPADLYVKRLLQRFQLSNYLALDLKRSSEYEPVLIQELLTLIIQIVQERRFCGLTAFENLQRELICKLATGDATHSQLVKSLPKDLSKLDILQEVLDRIAEYSNPSGLNQGKYSLRLPYWKHLDLYHPCSNLRELQIAEERYSRFCGVSALSTQLPRWTNIYQPLIGLARIATCETVLHVIRAVIFYAVFTDRSTESRAPDGVLITALHLLSLALDICTLEKESGLSTQGDFISPMVDVATEEIEMLNEFSRQSLLSLLVLLMRMHKKESADNLVETGNFSLSSLVEKLLKKFAEVDSKCLMKLQQFAPEVVSCQAAEKLNLSLVSDTEKRKMKARERQAAILAKMKDEQSKFLATLKSTECTVSDDSLVEKEERVSEDVEETGETHVCCLCHDPNSSNAVSFLILLQKSRLINFVNNDPPSWDKDWQSDLSESSRRSVANPLGKYSNKISVEASSSSELFQIIEGAVNEFARQAHSAEVDAFIDYIKLQFPEMRNLNVPRKSSDKRDKNVYSLETLEKDMFLSVHKELSSSVHDSDLRTDGRGLCSAKDGVTSSDEDTLLLGKYIAALTKDSNPSDNNNSRRVESSGKFFSYDGYGPSDCDGIHISSCGHAVHQGCLDRYLSSLKDRYIRRMVFEGGDIVDPDQGEFLCPVCRRLANSTLPAFLEDSCKLWEQPLDSIISSSRPLIDTVEERGSFRLSYALSMLQSAASVVSKGETLKALPVQRSRRITPNLVPVFQVLGQMYFPGKQDVVTGSARVSPSALLWDTLKYSLVSTEIAARCGKSCLAARRGIPSLYNEFRSSGGFILPLLLKTIKSARSKNFPDLFLRFRGLQHFAASICLGISYGKELGEASGREGKIWSMLKHSNSDMFPDMQFWGQASDPVLTRDPFSTLMWILFCLPFPFLSCKESLLSLIHLFYGVAVSQAIITYCSYSQCNVNDSGTHDGLISDIANLAGESAITKQFFFSNYLDPSYSVKYVINSLSLPYLRRCSLLWKLLCSPGASPFPSVREDIGKSLNASNGKEVGGGDMDEICELQNMFSIPSLDIVLKDKNLRSMVFKWFHHFANGFEDSTVQDVLYSTPSAPFHLMNLPFVYQDLVQRYIKAQCPDCKAVQGEPALCLLCGRLCSPAWKPCCRDSGCQAHSLACGAGTGVFLLVRKTTILLQRNARQAPWPSLYLDAFGEEDIDMQRGKPLFLNEERYAALTYMVASHGIDRSSKVLRQTRIGTLFLV
ncbi:E3 ubiquitin-protein ligase PRT6 [Silene latifolia]|uniref:E3 ubiquitin-protein ligase PRT6 n=1 Tax=Silene latifolia TaxID=37657 RepID=UPI003D774674